MAPSPYHLSCCLGVKHNIIHFDIASQLLAVIPSENVAMMHEIEVMFKNVYTFIQILVVLRHFAS